MHRDMILVMYGALVAAFAAVIAVCNSALERMDKMEP